MSRYYRTCVDCNAALDPGERCECRGNRPLANAGGRLDSIGSMLQEVHPKLMGM